MSFGPFRRRRQRSSIAASTNSEENAMETVRSVNDHSGVRYRHGDRGR